MVSCGESGCKNRAYMSSNTTFIVCHWGINLNYERIVMLSQRDRLFQTSCFCALINLSQNASKKDLKV